MTVGTWGFVCSKIICYTRVKKKGKAGSRTLKTNDPLTVERPVREQGVEYFFFSSNVLFVCLLLLPLAVYSSGSFGGCRVRTGRLDERNNPWFDARQALMATAKSEL
jgi:hypothetical protein